MSEQSDQQDLGRPFHSLQGSLRQRLSHQRRRYDSLFTYWKIDYLNKSSVSPNEANPPAEYQRDE